MDAVRDPYQPLLVASYERRFFDLIARIRVHASHQATTVLEAVEDALRATFSFERQDLAQAVTLSDIMAAIHGVEGVEAVDIDSFRFSHERTLQTQKKVVPIKTALRKVPTRLAALRARRNSAGTVLPAQHLSVQLIDLDQMS
jgi:hypothetical protein